MKFSVVIVLALLMCGCVKQEKLFDLDMMKRYEPRCDQYYAAYISGDISAAKKAMQDVIDLSLVEKSKAKFYWRFDIDIAFAEARLAVIAGEEGHEAEARRLFDVASEHELLGEIAMQAKEGGTNSITRWTPEFWRKSIEALDKQLKVKWKFPNPSPEPL